MEQIKSNFNTLIKTLSIPVPIFTSVTIGIVLGFEQINILNIKLSANLAAFFSVVILIFIYLQCYRSARVIRDGLRNSFGNKNEMDQKKSFLKTQSSIFNPFLVTGYEWEGAFTDYLGIFVNNISPMAISAVFGVLFKIKLYNATLVNMDVIFRSKQFSLPWGPMLINAGFDAVTFLFYVVYAKFLFVLSEMMHWVNDEDVGKRQILMFGTALSFFIISFSITLFYTVKPLFVLFRYFLAVF